MGNIPPSIIRQPPPPPPPHPPHHHLLMDGHKEGNTEMVGSSSSTRTFYPRRCKRKTLTNVESLADDLLFEILLRLPAQDVYFPARCVCRKWFHMIHTHSFIYAHLHHTSYGLFYMCASKPPIFMALRQGRIVISEFSYKFRCPIWVSCNGLFAEFECGNVKAIYITNPSTKQVFVLPPFFCPFYQRRLCGIGYVAASMEYKVVVTGVFEDVLKGEQCAILTVGVDKSWRNVQTKHLSPTVKKLFLNTPIITEGFMHWTRPDAQVLTLNVETEIITETPPPIPQAGQYKYYMSTGRYLSLLIPCRKFLWECWEMKPQTGEWRKLPNIDLEAQKHVVERVGCKHDDILIPSGWLKYLEVLVFSLISSVGSFIFFYNMLTEEMSSKELPTSGDFHRLVVHKNSLVWLGGC